MRLPIPLRLLLAAQPKLVRPVLEVVHRVITRHLLGQAGVKADEAHSVAVTLIQCFGSAANIHLHRRRPARARVAYSQLAHGSCSIDEFDQLPHLGGFDWSVRWYGQGSTVFSYEHTVAASLVPPIETVWACNCLEVRPAASMLGDSAEPGMRRA